MSNLRRTLLIMTIFGVAMAFLETAVVIYLRDIYYPGGFDFPLNPIEFNHGLVEVLREFATLVMLFSVAYIAGNNLTQRFGHFLWLFGIWDIFYYVFLKLLINWPGSLLTWDILFLIPITWVGPVIAPVIISLLMMFLGYSLLHYNVSGRARINRREWLLILTGTVVVLVSFMYEHAEYMLYQFGNYGGIGKPTDGLLFHLSFIPEGFTWSIFIPGALLITAGIIHFNVRQHRMRRIIKEGQWI